mgnify:FL=1
MKRDKLILLKSALRYFFFCIFMFFGGSVLIKHYFFHEEMDHATITENLFTSIFIGILFAIVFRSKWNGKDKESIFNLPDPKTDT